MQEGLLESSPSCVFAKSARLLDPYAHTGHCAVRTVKRSRNHGVDFFALLDHHNLQVYKPTGARIDMRCSGAIAVDVVGATAGVHSIAGGKPLATMWSTWVGLAAPRREGRKRRWSYRWFESPGADECWQGRGRIRRRNFCSESLGKRIEVAQRLESKIELPHLW
jgi:hypothetical protein